MIRRSMSRTRVELEANNFWSAHKFKGQAKELLDWLEDNCIPFKMGRSCIHVGKVKLYPHYAGRGNDTFTIVKNKDEIATFGVDCKTAEVIETIKNHF